MGKINYELLYVRQSAGTPKSIGIDVNGKRVETHYTETLDWSPKRLSGYSRNWGDAPLEVQKQVIDLIVDTAQRYELGERDTAYILAIARHESGFNPDAAAAITTASGVGQFVDKTGEGYGLNSANRFNAASNIDALVRHYSVTT